MVIKSIDDTKAVNVGTSDYLYSLYSTIVVRLSSNRREINDAIAFLNSGRCESTKCLDVARQFNLIRDLLSSVKPNDAVYDIDNPNTPAPWKDDLSPVITSCANLFITSDGKDLLYEIVCVLVYGFYSKKDVVIE